MSNDKSDSPQILLDPQQLVELNSRLGDMPLEMILYGPEMDLSSLDSVVRLVSFSQKHLRERYPDKNELVDHIWLWLTCLACDEQTGHDQRTYNLAMINELAALTGVVISNQRKRILYDHEYPGLNKNE